MKTGDKFINTFDDLDRGIIYTIKHIDNEQVKVHYEDNEDHAGVIELTKTLIQIGLEHKVLILLYDDTLSGG